MTPRERLEALSGLAQHPERPAPSPCVSVCRIDPASGWCMGCHRSIDEIIAWSRQSDAEHRQVWQHVRARAGLAQPAQEVGT